jgi:hypothetical protein
VAFFVLPAVMLELEKAYTNSEFVSVDPGIHMMAMEQPEAVASALAKFGEKVDQKFRLH